MTESGTPVIHVDTHLASVCRGGMAVVIRTDGAPSARSVTSTPRTHAGWRTD
jgi:hypothetical protein